MSRRSTAGLAATMLVGALALAGCSSDAQSISDQARQGDNKGFIAGDGRIEQLAREERAKPIDLSGTTLAGKEWNISGERGRVTVLNVWGAWCGPCQEELPHLQAVWDGYAKADKPVQFMGLDQRDSVSAAAATLKRFKVTYPSLRDDGGRSLLALQGKAATTPTTLVIDRQGRIAARVSGPITVTTLRDLVDDVLGEEKSGA